MPHKPRHICGQQCVSHFYYSINVKSNNDIEMWLSTRANGDREHCFCTELQACVWIRWYKLLSYKQLWTLLWWSTWAPLPLDPPPMEFKFLGWKYRLLLLFWVPLPNCHVLKILNDTFLVSMYSWMKNLYSNLHYTTVPNVFHLVQGCHTDGRRHLDIDTDANANISP
jgi:hypothetical protein